MDDRYVERLALLQCLLNRCPIQGGRVHSSFFVKDKKGIEVSHSESTHVYMSELRLSTSSTVQQMEYKKLIKFIIKFIN